MSVFGISSRKVISADVGVLAGPLLLVFVLVGLFISSFNFAYPKIKSQISDLNEIDTRLGALETKLGILRQVKDKVLGAADTSLISLPNENPSVWKLSQISYLAEKNEVSVANRKVLRESSSTSGLRSAKITFNASGSFDQTLSFLNDLEKSIPVLTLDSVSLERQGEGVSVKVSVSTYSAELPKLLPAITAPIKNLSDKEQKLLDKLEEMSRPEFTFLEPSGPFERTDPFN